MNNHHTIISSDAGNPAGATLNRQPAVLPQNLVDLFGADHPLLAELSAMSSARAQQIALGLVTPVGNTGGKSREGPLFEVLEGDNPYYPVGVDWLTFTVKGFYFNQSTKAAARHLERWTGGVLTIGGKMERRYNGYPACFEIVMVDGGDAPPLGWVGVSSESDHMRGWWCFNLTGVACSLVRDWSLLVRDMVADYHGRITRVDLALDDLAGKHPIAEAEEAYRAGLFDAGGRPPKAHTIKHLGPGAGADGDTFNVGKRSSGKMLRVYEKGKQLGDASSVWVRYEGELHNKDRVIPWEVLLLTAQYLRGMYPDALAWMRDFATPMYLEIIKEKGRIALERAILGARRQVGRLVRYLRDKLDLLDSDIVAKLIAAGSNYPQRLFAPDGCLPLELNEIDAWLDRDSIYDGGRQLRLPIYPSCIVHRNRASAAHALRAARVCL